MQIPRLLLSYSISTITSAEWSKRVKALFTALAEYFQLLSLEVRWKKLPFLDSIYFFDSIYGSRQKNLPLSYAKAFWSQVKLSLATGTHWVLERIALSMAIWSQLPTVFSGFGRMKLDRSRKWIFGHWCYVKLFWKKTIALSFAIWSALVLGGTEWFFVFAVFGRRKLERLQ